MLGASFFFILMKIPKVTFKNIVFGLIIVLLIIPASRQFIQIQLHKGLALFSPSIQTQSNREQINNYNWNLVDLNGSVYNFRQAENKIVLVSFWATWCPPCIAELPSMQKLYETYSDKIEFVFVSNEKNETIKAFMTKNGYNFKVYTPLEAPIINQFKVSSIPHTFLIDQKGTIVIDKNGAANWNSDTVKATIDKLLLL
ncbi:Thiol-disulfide isomerase or thioredoxin [Olleya namhaensis]|uniref:Thiol-disulfide isomerase or thioredoxin n=2 Tax=Olleya namhaensis TaxID=1144750 RepID=A0A1I3NTZ3_9FLAO|nr:Thiol-disulfide isomerase or thioredoxin [Olleya namhaensis]